MASITAEVSFMVYSQNGVGRVEKRIMELTHQDYIACSSSNRDKNENLKAWGKMLFPTAKDVKIQGAIKIIAKKVEVKKEPKKIKTSNNNPSSIGCLSILFFPFKVIWWLVKFVWKE